MTDASRHRVSSGSTGHLDAAIVGGGLMGAMVAFDLANAGLRVVLLERKPGLCMEASCTNTGALMLQLIRAAFIPHALRTIELWRTAPEWLGADMGYVQNGGLTVAYDDDEAQKLDGWMDDRRAAGAPVEIISRERARALEPALTDRIALASYCELDGFADAKLTGAGFRRGLDRARVDVRAPVRVSGIEREEHGFAITHEAGTARASRVILAGGVWLGEMSGWLGMPLPVECRVNQVSVTERMPPILTRSVCAATGRLSLKQSPVGTFLVGGGWQGIGSPHEGGCEIIPDHLVANLRIACFTVPAMREARLLRTWLGLGAHQRVLDVGGARLLLVAERQAIRVGDRIGADPTVVDPEPVDAPPHCLGECRVDGTSAREEGVGAGARNLLRVQDRPHARALQELRIGMPDPLHPRPHRLALVVLEIRDDEQLVEFRVGVLAQGEDLQLAEALAEGNVPFRAQCLLVAKEHDPTFDPLGADRAEGVVVDRLRQVDANHLGADGRVKRAELQRRHRTGRQERLLHEMK